MRPIVWHVCVGLVCCFWPCLRPCAAVLVVSLRDPCLLICPSLSDLLRPQLGPSPSDRHGHSPTGLHDRRNARQAQHFYPSSCHQ